ncbi:hypothetical protein X975_16432, partial [Stegodyphus mimosarum]
MKAHMSRHAKESAEELNFVANSDLNMSENSNTSLQSVRPGSSVVNVPVSTITIEKMPDGSLTAYAVIPLGNVNVLPPQSLSSETVTTSLVQEPIRTDKGTQPEMDADSITSPMPVPSMEIEQEPVSELGNPLSHLAESLNCADPVNTEFPSDDTVPVEDIISASAKLADICKCGPNKCKPHGRCCNGCPGMEGHYCHDGNSDDPANVPVIDSSLFMQPNENSNSSATAYTISVPESITTDLSDENLISVVDASCQTEEGVVGE